MITKLILFISLTFVLCCCSDPKNSEKKNDFVAKTSQGDSYELKIEKLNSIISKNPNDIRALIERGNLSFDHYDFYSAFSDAALAFRLDSNRFDSRLIYAKALLNRPTSTENDKLVSKRHFLKLIDEQPKNTDAIVGLANTYALLQDFENAEILIEKALKIDAKYIDAHRLKGSIFKIRYFAIKDDAESKKFAEALFDSTVTTYSYITQIDPEYHVAYMHLGLLFQQRQDPLCLDHYLSAVQLQPENLDYKYALGYAYGEFGREREAMKIYEEMINQDDTYFEAYCQTGQILQFKYNELDSALYYYSKVLDKDKNHLDAYVNMGIAYQDKGDITNALKNYAMALAIKPEERNPMVNLNQFNEQQSMARERADQLKKKL